MVGLEKGVELAGMFEVELEVGGPIEVKNQTIN